MKTFEQFIESKQAEPLLWEAASLFVELGIDPQEYFSLLAENWGLGATQLNQAAGNTADAFTNGLSGLGNLGVGAATGAWNAGTRAANAVGASPIGQGIKGWWQNFNSGERKLDRAAALIQRALSDPVIAGLNGGNSVGILTQIIKHLASISQSGRAARASTTPGAAPTPSPGQPPAPGATP